MTVSNVVSMPTVQAQQPSSPSTRGNLALVAMMPISFVMVLLTIIAMQH